MQRTSFNADWGVRRLTSPFLELMGQAEPPKPVTLPHDWLISQPRSADHVPGALNGFHGEDVIEYVKSFEAPDGYRDGRVEIAFDGIYRGAMVFVNDTLVGQRPYGYIPFSVRIDQQLRDGENRIRVECRNHLDARWYTGLGIYRDTWLLTGGPAHVARNGVRIRTVRADADLAVVDVVTALENDSTALRTVRVLTELVAPDGMVVAADSAELAVRPQETAQLRRRFTVDRPDRWSTDHPALHTCRTRLEPADAPAETVESVFGIRALDWDTRHGLRINGETVKLRGGCIHHDNGPIGAATIARAEERRVELLKAAGYNAIRSAHNPTSAAMLDACDRLGMLVLDEFTDGWTSPTAGFGYGIDFPEWWRRDLTELVARDFNHPSVVMYSIGNEVTDTGNRWDAMRGRDMVDHLKTLDDTRPVTNGVNPMMTVLHDLKEQAGRDADEGGGVNSFMQAIGESTQSFAASDLATERLEEPMSQLDIAGYNYAYGRYELDIERHPQRLLLGTEGLPNKLDEVWPLVQQHAQVIGEFGWTAWEYSGEAGLGADKPAEDGFFGPYPWRLSGTGDIGITGQRRTISHWRETVWDWRLTPTIAVSLVPEGRRDDLQRSLYTWSDSLISWSWPGHEGDGVSIEAYSAADEIDLVVNGESVGRAPAGPDHRFMAVFETAYRPGTLQAIAFKDGREVARTTLRSAGDDVRVIATPDRSRIRADDRDLAYIEIAVCDGEGIVHPLRDVDITIDVQGPGVLQGLASDALASVDDYSATTCRTYRGRALAVIRPVAAGEITIRVEADGIGGVETTVWAQQPGRPDNGGAQP